MKKYLEKGHELNVEYGWICQQCKAKGPAMNKCECPSDGCDKINFAVSNEQSNKRVRPGQDLKNDAGEGQQLRHDSGSVSST
eukprot:2246659-Heterocapsa_arctica.AAC.1